MSARLILLAPLLWVVTVTAAVTAAYPVRALELSLPIDCDIGKSCFIQNFVDAVKGPGVRDFGCGEATYDGHKGTDFRLISTADVKRGVPVLAAADGIVKGLRDGVPDVLYTKQHAGVLRGRECGNGVVIAHEQGWETQYCHLRRGSLHVRRGQRVSRGTPLGDVGYSGKAAFAHLHLSVRHNKQVIDPFTGQMPARRQTLTTGQTPATGQSPSTSPTPSAAQPMDAVAPGRACANSQHRAGSLWAPDARRALQYRSGQIIEIGFSAARPQDERWESGLRHWPRPVRSSPVLIFAARAIKLHRGDRLQMSISGPGNLRLQTTTAPRLRAKATYRAFIGKKRKAVFWPSGIYQGQVRLIRKGRVISHAQASIEIR